MGTRLRSVWRTISNVEAGYSILQWFTPAPIKAILALIVTIEMGIIQAVSEATLAAKILYSLGAATISVWLVNGITWLISKNKDKRCLFPPAQEQLTLDVSIAKDIERQLDGLTHAERKIILRFIETDGMPEPQINQYAQSQGFALIKMGDIYNKTTFLSHDFEGQWRVKREFVPYLKNAIISKLRD